MTNAGKGPERAMLDEFCASVNNRALLEISIALIRQSLPVWEKHFHDQPEDLARLNQLAADGMEVEGAFKTIAADFPHSVLKNLELSDKEAEKPRVLHTLKKRPILDRFLATTMRPLTNTDWDDVLPRSVRLIFTACWNILTWICYRTESDAGETHAYLAINQAADCLLSEKIATIEEINALLTRYAEHKRTKGDEDELRSLRESNPMKQAFDEVSSGKKKNRHPPTGKELTEILRQMKEEGKSYWDDWLEYTDNINRTYSYNSETGGFQIEDIDMIVGGYMGKTPMSEKEMREAMSQFSVIELRKSGFDF